MKIALKIIPFLLASLTPLVALSSPEQNNKIDNTSLASDEDKIKTGKELYYSENYINAKSIFTELAKKNYPEAYYFLGKIYSRDGDVDNGIKYLTKYLSYKEINHRGNANVEVGKLLLKRDPSNLASAVKYFMDGVNNGDIEGAILISLESLKRNKDPKEIKKSLSIITNLVGKTHGKAEEYLAYIYLHGIGVNPDEKKYEKYIKLSFADGNSDALLSYILYYINKYPSKKEAISKMIHKLEASPNKDKKIYKALGKFYFLGEYVPKDYHNAFNYFIKAVDYKDQEVLYSIALMYYNGLGVDRDIKKTLPMFEALSFGTPYSKSKEYYDNVREQLRIRAKYALNNLKLFGDYVIGLNRLQINSLLTHKGWTLSKSGKDFDLYVPKKKNLLIKTIVVRFIYSLNKVTDFSTQYAESIIYDTTKDINFITQKIIKKYGANFIQHNGVFIWDKGTYKIRVWKADDVFIEYIFKDFRNIKINESNENHSNKEKTLNKEADDLL